MRLLSLSLIDALSSSSRERVLKEVHRLERMAKIIEASLITYLYSSLMTRLSLGTASTITGDDPSVCCMTDDARLRSSSGCGGSGYWYRDDPVVFVPEVVI